ncbi:MAG: hypothetical protein KDJ31_12500 [Candidatus Competibacteraceae bacterium]|nr:hypothetical protein [Candidatus Competibacteraceae bacterium]HRY15484.1 hypothetical protein [Candidatus Competibacteraceae bacterium]
MRRWLGPLLGILLLGGIGVGIYFSAQEQNQVTQQQLLERRQVLARGVIGSEKEDFFRDAKVIEALRQRGLTVTVEKAGSRQIANLPTLEQYDFAFPAGLPGAEKIRRERRARSAYTPFFTPMVVASWRPIAEILERNGLARQADRYYFLNMKKLVDLMNAGKRWNDLDHNEAYAVGKSILISSTDVRKSNSAAMYLALFSFIVNGDAVVQSEEQICRIYPAFRDIFLRQGFTEYSSEAPFEDYQVMGMGKSPLVIIYESQFLQLAAQGRLRSEMVLLYPEPTIYTKHVLIAFTEAGQRLGEALETDPALRRLAVEYGFRNPDIVYFREFASQHQVPIADTLVNVVEPPTYEIIEMMIASIEASLDRNLSDPLAHCGQRNL